MKMLSKKTRKDKTRIFLNTLFVVGDTVIDKFAFFIINIIIARYLDVEMFGEYTTSLAYATLFSTFVDIGINATLVRSINRDRSHEPEHITNVIIIKSIISLIVYISLCVSLYFTNYTANTIYLTLIFGLVRIGSEYMKAFYAIYTAHERFLGSTIINVVFSSSFLVITLMVVMMGGNYFHFAFTRLAVVSAFVVFLVAHVLKNYNLKFNYPALKEFFRQALFFGLATVFGNSYHRLNVIILSLFYGTTTSGFFNNSFLFISSLFFLPSNASRVLITYLYKISFRENRSKFQFAFDIYSKVLSLGAYYIALIFFLFPEEIITLVYGKKYIPAADSLKILSLSLPFLFNVSGNIITALDLQKIRSIKQGIALVINVVSNIILIYFFKADGAAVATLLTYFSLFFMFNRYLVKNGYISFRNSLIVEIKTALIALGCGILYYMFFMKVFYIYSIITVSTIYWAAIYIVLITKDDIRIFKETFGR